MHLCLKFNKAVSIKIAILSIGVLILQACSSVSSDWKTAQTLNTQHSTLVQGFHSRAPEKSASVGSVQSD
jgi:ABC-type oligopeptide transport system substrate-binding subunit